MELDDSGVQAGVRTFRHPVHCPRFVLLPMVHVAEPAFYEDVTARVRRCDLVASRVWDTLIDDTERDRRLGEALTSIHVKRSQGSIAVAVVYGAAHMRAAVSHLRTLGYGSTGCERLTVFSFDAE